LRRHLTRQYNREEFNQGSKFLVYFDRAIVDPALHNGIHFFSTAIPQILGKKGWKLDENLPHGRS
jgi:hypothetical protein